MGGVFRGKRVESLGERGWSLMGKRVESLGARGWSLEGQEGRV